MWRDLKLMLWKEWKQAISNKQLVPMVILPLYMGIILPIVFTSADVAKDFVNLDSLLVIIMTLMLSFIGSISSSVFVAYSFAGEREANTLPTLLTTRLSDTVLVLGKAFFAFLISLSMNILTVICFLVVMLFRYGSITKAVAPFASLTGILNPLIIPLLFSMLSISIGMLISTKIIDAKTASGVAFLPEVPVIALVGFMLLGNPFHLSAPMNFIIISLFLAALSGVFIAVTIGFFSRERMIAR
jgi:ABC-type transport system involved in multi-copper enzyme maturation permease subunit